MKKVTLKILMVVIILGAGATASAQTNVPSTSATPKAVQRMQEAKQKVASSTEARREALAVKLKNQIEHRYSKMLKRYEATIDRETAIMNKINSRIAKIKINGGNTTEAEKLISEAKIHLDEAVLDLEELETLSFTQVTNQNLGTTTKALFDGLKTMRAAGFEIEKHLREAHKNLQKSIGILRGVSQLNNATSTKQN